MTICSIASTSSSSSPAESWNGGLPYSAVSTLRGEAGSPVPRSPSAIRRTISGLAVPPPDPAKSGQQGVPAGSRVPPKPYGDIGLSRTIDATASGWSIVYCSTTPPPSDQPSRCTGRPAGTRVLSVSSACRSSAKSRTPRRASTPASADSPKPRRSGARQRYCSASTLMDGAKNRPDETLPCTSTSTGASPGPAVSTWVRSRDVGTSTWCTAMGVRGMGDLRSTSGGRGKDGEDLRAAVDALGRLPRLEHHWCGESLAGPSPHVNWGAAAGAGNLAGQDRPGVGALDRQRGGAGHLAAGDLDVHRDVGRGFRLPAGGHRGAGVLW